LSRCGRPGVPPPGTGKTQMSAPAGDLLESSG
jgi:hypothetical protein